MSAPDRLAARRSAPRKSAPTRLASLKSALRRLGDGSEGSNQIQKGDAGEVVIRKSKEDIELEELKESLSDTPHVGVIVDLAKTLDQARAILTFLEEVSVGRTR